MYRDEINPFWRNKCSGKKRNYVLNYELSIYLGNVIQVVTERKYEFTILQNGIATALDKAFISVKKQVKAQSP